MDCVFLLTARWTTDRGNELIAPSHGLLDRTVHGRQEFEVPNSPTEYASLIPFRCARVQRLGGCSGGGVR